MAAGEPDSGQGEPRMAGFENPSGEYLKYVSTGSAETRHLQATIIGIPRCRLRRRDFDASGAPMLDFFATIRFDRRRKDARA
jgi:hypothetical protein